MAALENRQARGKRLPEPELFHEGRKAREPAVARLDGAEPALRPFRIHAGGKAPDAMAIRRGAWRGEHDFRAVALDRPPLG
jgi:hypothetical protein